MKLSKIMKDGIINNNPVMVQLVGMCSVLAISSNLSSSLAMGIAVTVVLIGSNVVVSLLKNVIPDEIRIPAFIVIIATFVTAIEMTMQAYMEPAYEALGIFLPLIVVNCTILARAEAFASKNDLVPSLVDGVSVGVGFTLVMIVLGSIREILGKGEILGKVLFPGEFAIGVVGQPAGAFIVLGLLIGVFNYLKNKKATE